MKKFVVVLIKLLSLSCLMIGFMLLGSLFMIANEKIIVEINPVVYDLLAIINWVLGFCLGILIAKKTFLKDFFRNRKKIS